jgi:D-alanyl-D-alanine carboxypeptidase
MMVDAVDTYIQSAFQRHHIAGLTLAVLQNGVVIKQQAYGVASLELNVPMTVTTRYNIGALTKMFTGAAIMTLIEAGHLSSLTKSARFCPPSQHPGTRSRSTIC